MERLKRRRDFLSAARGPKIGRPGFVLEIRARGDEGAPRVGFTVTKRTAKKAVERNRIRRRLKEAVRLSDGKQWRVGHDYVLVGRRALLTGRFTTIAAEIGRACAEAGRVKSRQSDGPA